MILTGRLRPPFHIPASPTPGQDGRFGIRRRQFHGRIGGLVPRRVAALAKSEVWYLEQEKCWRNRAVWYLFVARSEVWYPASGESRGLVPARAGRANRDQAFLRAPGTKSPKLAETGVPNLGFCQKQAQESRRRYQTSIFAKMRPSANYAVRSTKSLPANEPVRRVQTGSPQSLDSLRATSRRSRSADSPCGRRGRLWS